MVDIHGGHFQADGGNIAHGKVFVYFKKRHRLYKENPFGK
jgi:hypothetical protein